MDCAKIDTEGPIVKERIVSPLPTQAETESAHVSSVNVSLCRVLNSRSPEKG